MSEVPLHPRLQKTFRFPTGHYWPEGGRERERDIDKEREGERERERKREREREAGRGTCWRPDFLRQE